MTDETSRLPDPVFAAIEAFKAAGDAFDIAYDVQESASDRDRPTAQRALDVASAAFADARETFLNVPPTTIEGIAALLIFVSNEPDIAEWLILCPATTSRQCDSFTRWRDRFAPWRVARAAAAWRTRHSV